MAPLLRVGSAHGPPGLENTPTRHSGQGRLLSFTAMTDPHRVTWTSPQHLAWDLGGEAGWSALRKDRAGVEEALAAAGALAWAFAGGLKASPV